MNIDGQSRRDEDTAMTVDEAGSAFAHLLGATPVEAAPTGAADTEEDEALAPTEGALDDGDEFDAAEDAGEDADEADDEDAEGEEPEDQDDAAPEDPVFTVEVDGQELQVTQADLIKSYQLDATAQRRLEAAATKNKALDAEYHGLQALNQRLGSAVEWVEATLAAPDYDEAELEALRLTDPAEYSARRLEVRERQEQLARLEAEQRRLEAVQAHRNQAAREARLSGARQALLTAFPEWKDSGRAEAAMGELARYAESKLGVDLREFDQIEDARVIQALHKARLYDQLTAKAAKAGETVRGKARAAPVLTPGAFERTTPSQLSQVRSIKRLKQTGSIRDAGAAFSAFV